MNSCGIHHTSHITIHNWDVPPSVAAKQKGNFGATTTQPLREPRVEFGYCTISLNNQYATKREQLGRVGDISTTYGQVVDPAFTPRVPRENSGL